MWHLLRRLQRHDPRNLVEDSELDMHLVVLVPLAESGRNQPPGSSAFKPLNFDGCVVVSTAAGRMLLLAVVDRLWHGPHDTVAD